MYKHKKQTRNTRKKRGEKKQENEKGLAKQQPGIDRRALVTFHSGPLSLTKAV